MNNYVYFLSLLLATSWAKSKICHNWVYVLNFLVTFLLLTTHTALYDRLANILERKWSLLPSYLLGKKPNNNNKTTTTSLPQWSERENKFRSLVRPKKNPSAQSKSWNFYLPLRTTTK